MKPNDIYTKLKNEFGNKILEFIESADIDACITIDSCAIKEVCLFARDNEDMQFDYLSLLTGMDYKDNLGVVYHLFSTVHKHKITLKTILNREKPNALSVERV